MHSTNDHIVLDCDLQPRIHVDVCRDKVTVKTLIKTCWGEVTVPRTRKFSDTRYIFFLLAFPAISVYVVSFCHVVPLGSIPELPAESCSEIKASEGNEMVNGDYWIYSDGNGQKILARCEGMAF